MKKAPNDICKKCGLFKNCLSPMTLGHIEGKPSNIMVIGEYMSSDDDKYQTAFSGKLGRKAKLFLEAAGFTPSDIYFSHGIKCLPTDYKSEVTFKRINLCRTFLLNEIEVIDPDLIIAMGNFAYQAVSGKRTALSEVRGIIQELNFNGKIVKVLPTYNVKFISDFPERETIFFTNLLTAKKALKEKAKIDYIPVLNSQSVQILEYTLKNQKSHRIAVDVETNSLDPFSSTSKLLSLSVSFSFEGQDLHIVAPIDHNLTPLSSLDKSRVRSILKEAFLDPKNTLVFHNSLFDLIWVENYLDIEIETSRIRDTMLEHFISVTELQGTHGLKRLSCVFTDYQNYDKAVEDFFVKQRIAKKKRDYEMLPFNDVLLPYNAYDTAVTLELSRVFDDCIKKEGMEELYENVIKPSIRFLANVRKNGVHFILDSVEEFTRTVRGEQEVLVRDMRKDQYIKKTEQLWTKLKEDKENEKRKNPIQLETLEFNPNSTTCMHIYLYKVLEFGVIKKTATGNPSCDEEVLTEYYKASKERPISQILEIKKLKNLISKYSSNVIKTWLGKDNLVHPNYNIHGARTGRLSSNAPNFQNFPKKGKLKVVRSLIGSRFKNGGVLRADYSQMELRVLAWFSEDPGLLGAFERGEDIHKYSILVTMEMTEQQYDMLPEEEQGSLRQSAKRRNFGLVYGQGPSKLAEMLTKDLNKTVTVDEAAELQEKLLEKFPGLNQWINKVKREAERDGYVRTPFGRKRRLTALLYPENRERYAEAQRQAVNMVIQSTASDITLLAGVKLEERLRKEGFKSKMIGIVHDELLIDYHPSELWDAANLMKECMLDTPEFLTVKLGIEIEYGPNWKDTEIINI